MVPPVDERLGLLAGVVGPILIIVGFFAIDAGGTTPPDGDSADLAREFVQSHSRVVIGSVVGAVGGLLLVVFGAALRLQEDLPDSRHSLLAGVAHGCALIAAAGVFVFASFNIGTTAVDDATTVQDAARALGILSAQAGGVMLWGLIGLVAALSIGAFTQSLIPRALAGIGLILAAGSIALVATDHGGVSLALLPWVSIASALLLARAASAASPSPNEAAE